MGELSLDDLRRTRYPEPDDLDAIARRLIAGVDALHRALAGGDLDDALCAQRVVMLDELNLELLIWGVDLAKLEDASASEEELRGELIVRENGERAAAAQRQLASVKGPVAKNAQTLAMICRIAPQLQCARPRSIAKSALVELEAAAAETGGTAPDLKTVRDGLRSVIAIAREPGDAPRTELHARLIEMVGAGDWRRLRPIVAALPVPPANRATSARGPKDPWKSL